MKNPFREEIQQREDVTNPFRKVAPISTPPIVNPFRDEKNKIKDFAKETILPISFRQAALGGVKEAIARKEEELWAKKVRPYIRKFEVPGVPKTHFARYLPGEIGAAVSEFAKPSFITQAAVIGGISSVAMQQIAATSAGRLLLQKYFPTLAKGLLQRTAAVPVHPLAIARQRQLAQVRIPKPTPTISITSKTLKPVVTKQVQTIGKADKAGNINLTKYQPEIQKGIQEMVAGSPEIAKHKVLHHSQTTQIASELKDTPVLRKLFDMPKGQLRAEVYKLRTGEDALIRNMLKTDLDDLGKRISEVLAHKQTSLTSRAAYEVGGALEQFKIPVKTQQQLADLIMTKIKSIKVDPILSKQVKIRLINGLMDIKKTMLTKEVNPTLFDKGYFVWLNSILSDPRTHMVNTGSNTLFALAKIPEKFAQATADLFLTGLEKVGIKRIGKIPLTGRRQVFFGEIPAMIKGLKYKGKIPIAAGSKFEEYMATQGIKKVLPTSLLQIEDRLGKTVIGRMELFATAYRKGVLMRKGMAKGLTGLGRVRTEQLYRTFQQQPGIIAHWLMKSRQDVYGIRWIIPFVKTPANLISAGLERTPLGVAFLGKAATQEQLATRLGLLGLSSSVSAWIGWQYFKGNVTGDAPINAAKRDAFYREGKQPNSIRLFNKWIPLERIEPLGSAFAIIANLIQKYEQSDKEIPAEKIIDTLSGLGRTLTNKTYLSGLTNLIKALSDPEMYGANWGRRIVAGMFSPGLLNYIAQLKDPYIREPMGVLETVKARLPGLSEQVSPRLTAFGEPIKRPTPAIPFRISKTKFDLVDKELKRLEIYPTRIPKTYKTLPLSSRERNFVTTLEGKIIKRRLNWLVISPKYRQLSDREREKEIRKIIQNTRTDIRGEFFKMKIRKDLQELNPEKRMKYILNLMKKNVLKLK